ncbi:MAG: hypothetical protein AB1489_07290, partial [Acidobacteriota bacterium]
DQIENFIYNWFGNNQQKASLCWAELQANPPTKELASVPLLLTLLCLAFDDAMEFPANRAELYKDAIDALLRKWDSSRNIKREQIYKKLSFQRKGDIFSRIAATTFETGQYFIPQRTLEQYIAEFIENLPDAKSENLDLDSEAILKGIEAQHGIFVERARGIYSFSHLTFQEYFTAKYIVDNATKGTLRNLVEDHIMDDKWREVFLLTAGMLSDADELLLMMKKKADSLVDEKLAEFLSIVLSNPELDKAIKMAISEAGITSDIAPTAIRALKISCVLVLARALALDFARTLALDLVRALARVLTLDLALNLALALTRDRDRDRDRDLAINLAPNLAHNLALEFYLKTNLLIVQCLNTECYVSKASREKILDGLLTVPQWI